MRLRRHWLRVLILSVVSLFGILVVSYISTLIAHTVSARRVSKMLDTLEAIRIGDPASSLEKAVPQCTLSQMEEKYRCEIFSGWGRWQWQRVLIHIPTEHYLPVIWRLRRLGIQPWYITVDASIRDGRIRNLHLDVFVTAGRKSLGADWKLDENVPPQLIRSNTTADQTRTFINGYSITSLPGGEGIHIAATPDSEPRELQARHINRACLRSVNRCDELCELLPDAIPVLDDRGWHWADCAPNIP
jgi:hypothetical protein